MKIQARRLDGGEFALQFDGTEVRLTAADLKALLVQVTRVLVPGSGETSSGADRLRDLINRMQSVADVGVQAFLMRADHNDVVVLLKAGESTPDHLERLFANMSERSRKICREDVAYSFPDTIPPSRADAAAVRLHTLVRALDGEGRLPPR